MIAKLTELRAGGLVIGGGHFFASYRDFRYREFAAAGGLLSYMRFFERSLPTL